MDKIIGIIAVDHQNNVNVIDFNPVTEEDIKVLDQTLMIENVIFHKNFFQAIQLCDQNTLKELTEYLYPP